MELISSAFFSGFLPYLPSFLAKMVGMGVAAVFLGRVRTPALWALAGFGLLAACDVWAGFNSHLIVWLHSLGGTIHQTAPLLSLIDLFRSLVASVGIGCLVMALALGWESRG